MEIPFYLCDGLFFHSSAKYAFLVLVAAGAPPPGAPQMNRPPPGFGQPAPMPAMSTAGPTGPTHTQQQVAGAPPGAPPTSHPPPGFPPPGAHINPQVYRQNYGAGQTLFLANHVIILHFDCLLQCNQFK